MYGAITLSNLGRLAAARGDGEGARVRFEGALDRWRDVGDRSGILETLVSLGALTARRGDTLAAERLLAEAATMARRTGERGRLAAALRGLGEVALRRGDRDEARTSYGESLRLAHEMGDREAVASGLEALAALDAHSGQLARAARLFAAGAALRETIGAPLLPPDRGDQERRLGALRAALGEPAFTAAWGAGWAMAADDAVAEALDDGIALGRENVAPEVPLSSPGERASGATAGPS